mmetsp:Transcript_11087/g.23411  ORF Transcript_11087/g.23411 Transcript_11087/m.23411 type:complete len:230 (+) Transcript_11087:222-911(+)
MYHLSRILRSVLHCSHARRLFSSSSIHEGMIDLRGKKVLVQILQNLRFGIGFELISKHSLVLPLSRKRFNNLVHLMVGGGVFVRIVNNYNRIIISSSLRNKLRRHSSSQGEISGCLHLSHSQFDLFTVHTTKLPASLIANNNNITFLSLGLKRRDARFRCTGDEGVDTAAKTFVGGNRDDETFLWQLVPVCILDHLRFAAQGISPLIERNGSQTTSLVSLKFGSRNHFH